MMNDELGVPPLLCFVTSSSCGLELVLLADKPGKAPQVVGVSVPELPRV